MMIAPTTTTATNNNKDDHKLPPGMTREMDDSFSAMEDAGGDDRVNWNHSSTKNLSSEIKETTGASAPSAKPRQNHVDVAVLVLGIGIVVSVLSFLTMSSVFSAVVVTLLMVILAGVMAFYMRRLSEENQRLAAAAARSTKLVKALYPDHVADQLLAAAADEEVRMAKRSATSSMISSDNGDRDGNSSDDDRATAAAEQQIAEVFANVTIVFADLVGFTSWSSVREPGDVFCLLETLYGAYDELAKKHSIFKIETVGDCYVAVCGIPKPIKNHAVHMCRFARDCMFQTWELTKQLECKLGPDTGDLTMRMGLHSGKVVGGVLRGEKARFQLFGDTMNTCARMESNGRPNCIHLSQETAELLMAARRDHWIQKRQDKIVAKGKGELQTYWLDFSGRKTRQERRPSYSASSSGDSDEMDDTKMMLFPAAHSKQLTPEAVRLEMHCPPEKKERLIQWSTDVFLRLLKQVVAQRNAMMGGATNKVSALSVAMPESNEIDLKPPPGKTYLEEAVDVIELVDRSAWPIPKDFDNLELDPMVTAQLQEYVTSIAALYKDHPFNGFERASHATMTFASFLSKIGHSRSFGITSDALTQFACFFALLIHDVGHPGVPNSQLVQDQAPMAARFGNISVAEQNSIELAFNLLLEDRFAALRKAIYGSSSHDKNQFKHLVINSVLATDSADEELARLRNDRWKKAFNSDKHGVSDDEPNDRRNRQATIVIEYLMQLCDVAYRCQHFQLFHKWAERRFVEVSAYASAAIVKEGWYDIQIRYFTNHVLPMTGKLEDCGVLGAGASEYVSCANKNLAEWQLCGHQFVQDMHAKAVLYLEGGATDAASP